MKTLRYSWVLAALLGMSVTAHAAPAQTVIPSRIDKAATRLTAQHWPPALVVVMVDDGHAAIAGYGKLADGRKPDARSVFEIGSVTKTFTALMLARQVEAGRLALDTPVATLLPGFTLPQRDGKTITLGQLAEQTSGLPRVPGNLKPRTLANPYVDYGADKLRAFLADYRLTRDPGAKYAYSNLGFGLLGYALATHAGSAYAALLKHDVLDPLHMTSTAGTLTPALRERLVPGHDGDGKPAQHWQWPDTLAGAGAILSDGQDMLAYLKANMGATRTPLAAAMQLAHKPRRDIGNLGRIGLAWMTTPTPNGDVVWHNGETGGYASFIGFTADGRRGVVLLSNAAGAADTLTRLGVAALAPGVPVPDTRKPAAIKHVAIDLPVSTLQDYVGTYPMAPNFVIRVFLKDGQLFAQATGQQAFVLHASRRDAFFADVSGIRIDFVRDAHGKVDALVLHQAGHATPVPRKP